MFKNAFANLASEIEFKPQKNFDGLFEKTWQSNCKPRVYFDVHWYLSYPNLFDFDHSKITERSTAHPLYERQKLRVLSNEDQLVNLAIHLMRDCDFYDYGLLDCHEIIHSQNVDLELTVNIAKGWGAKTCLFYLFWLCNKHLNTSIAAEVLAHIKPNSAKHVLCKWLMKNLLVKPTVTKTYNHRLKQLIVVFLFIDRPLKALRFYLVYALKGLLRINMKKN
jgi:hypothetical protein